MTDWRKLKKKQEFLQKAKWRNPLYVTFSLFHVVKIHGTNKLPYINNGTTGDR